MFRISIQKIAHPVYFSKVAHQNQIRLKKNKALLALFTFNSDCVRKKKLCRVFQNFQFEIYMNSSFNSNYCIKGFYFSIYCRKLKWFT